MNRTSQRNKRRAHESGQAAVFLVLAMGLFLIGSMGFVVDGANLWFHRQSAQTAADAACTAGAMNMLSVAAGANPPNPNWIGTSSFQCSGSDAGGGNGPNSGFVPCQYAALNGYPSSGLQANKAGTEVSVSFPGSFASVPTCSDTSPLCTAEGVAATPYMQVNVTDRVQTTFIGMLNGGHTVDVGAKAMCGLSNALSAVPVLVLNPNAPNSGLANTIGATNATSLTIVNGPQKSVQVNSSDTAAVNLSSITMDLSSANGGNGGDFAVAARESMSQANGSNLNWIEASGVISDPFATIPPPVKPAPARTTGPDCAGISGVTTCQHFFPGYYSGGITVTGASGGGSGGGGGEGGEGGGGGGGGGSVSGVAVFDPGIYYLDGDFTAGMNTCLRPNPSTGSDGTVFYFHGASSLQVSRMSGGASICATTTVPISSLRCTGSSPITGLPAGGVSGNVLLAPCTGAYGDPLGGEQRGMLFFHDRDTQPAVQPKWRSTGSFALVGNVYFHYCNSTSSSGSGSGANCDPNAFTDVFNLGSGSPAYILGDIVVDQLQLGQIGGASNITVNLSPNPQYHVLKGSLLQ